jgi:hypothetical protein
VSLAHNPVNILFCVLFIFFNESTVGDSPPVFIQKKEHDDGLVINLRDNILFVAETLDELPEGLSHLLHDVGQVQMTPGHSQVARKLLMNYRHRSDHERTDPVGSPTS